MQHTSDKFGHYSIYRPRKDERLSWPSRLTYSGRLTHIGGHPSAIGRAWDRESSPVKDRRSTTVPLLLSLKRLCILLYTLFSFGCLYACLIAELIKVFGRYRQETGIWPRPDFGNDPDSGFPSIEFFCNTQNGIRYFTVVHLYSFGALTVITSSIK